MAQILKEETSLSEAGGKRILGGIGAIILGILILYFTQQGLIGVGILIIGLIIVKQGSAFWKGSEGEDLVTGLLEHMPDNWYIINDMVVGSSQIDHIVVCPKGVYTIETKNYRGTIYGNANDQYWMQVFPNGSEYDFYNPVKQGNKHSLELSKYLEENNLKSWVNTVVVFPGDEVTLKVYSPKTKVLYLKELAAYFMEQRDTLDQKFCDDVVECIQKLVPKEESVSQNN
ncbi:Nuclease-related domain-containing protein [Methanolobus vulcani]|uniref:Nuclease-related domain-containing protein n=1 Tax=Methanolobus vulcani TaxID=38026 RepID=A0A7Z7AZ34_9EURY|nr:nuclease-related domain-containing protein [Methanolobus vulcani]SDF85468.1 Nuclease-related domain-containing protein [Methanolobus vulcani]